MTNQIVKYILIGFFVMAYLGSLIQTVEGFKENSWFIKNYRKSKAIDTVTWIILILLIYFYT